MQYTTICEESLLQRMPNTILGDGQTQQHGDNQLPSTRLALLLRDKSDNSRKMRIAMPITRPTVAYVEVEAKLLAKTRNKTRGATVRQYLSLSNSFTSLFPDTERRRRISVHSQVV